MNKMKDLQEVYNIFQEIKNKNSTLDKQSILKNNKDNELFKECLKFLLDPAIVTGISKKKINKKFDVTVCSYICNSILELFDYLKQHNTGSDADIIYCQQFFIYDEGLNDFIKSLITKSLKVGLDVTTVNKVYSKDFIHIHEVQQAYSLDKYKLKDNEWFALSLKLNGVRGTYINGKFISRQGKEIKGLEHIIKEMQNFDQDYVYDGELIRNNVDNLSDNENFRIGTGILNSDDADKSSMRFVIFDCLPIDEFKNGISELKYTVRLYLLDAMEYAIETRKLQNVAIVKRFYEGTDQSKIKEYLKMVDDLGCEGLMLNRDVPYRCKRHNGILKVKSFKNADLEVVGYTEGEGRLKGVLGALVVKFHNNLVSIGSGFSDAERADFWNRRDELVGRIIQVKYKEVSVDKNTGLESIQFPIYQCLREVGKKVSYE